ncbi:MAG TPA: hypothetical protein PLC53_01945 [Bacilli bacterium]|nr:hypothetical protein [Bacilli bacterium]
MNQSIELSSFNVEMIYRQCLINREEIELLKKQDGCVDLTTPECLLEEDMKVMFSTKRLKSNISAISELVSQIYGIDNGVPFHMLNRTIYENIWTMKAEYIEKIVLLGIASGLLDYCTEKEEWDKLPYGLPVVIKNRTISKADNRNLN